MDKCCALPWDDILAYPTVKIVKVRYRYLGLLRYSVMILIFIYIVVYVIILNKGYYATDVPVGAIENSLEKPPGMIYPKNYSYCLQNQDTAIIDPLYCQVQDGVFAYQPVDQSAAMFITTRFSQTLERYVCGNLADDEGCDIPWVPDNGTGSEYDGTQYYVPGIEEFTIKFSHFFQAREFYLTYHKNKYAQSNAQMRGRLTRLRGKKIEKFNKDSADIVSLQLLLDSVSVNLDDLSDVPTNVNESKRHSGIILVLGIDYSNFDTDHVQYQYTVTRIPKTEYKVVTTQNFNETLRLTNNRHGVKIFFFI